MRDAGEFDVFYHGTAGRVFGQLYLMTGDRADAEDAVAEAFLRAWERWETVRESDCPEAWVRRVAYRIAVSNWRKAVNRVKAHYRGATSDRIEATSPDHVAIVQVLRQIPADQRRAIVLFHLLGLSVQEVAEEVGAPTGTVKARLARGRRAIADLLTDVDHAVEA
ncbi:sigma-70 family RNA polymerase sigma factor [Actinoplanes sp. NPDC049548]|uniref:sigma-70 family RNA polymerase sigma factor n=1 Tax=Actinoplanes sp. NPDC049548 TaxID=3155152 RepID=UPI003427071A